MKIESLEIRTFGIWSQLKLSGLSSGVQCIYGTNGSGKTTVVECLSGLMSGFDEPHCRGFWSGADVARASAEVSTSAGRYRLERIAEERRRTFAMTTLSGSPAGRFGLAALTGPFPRNAYHRLFHCGAQPETTPEQLLEFLRSPALQETRACQERQDLRAALRRQQQLRSEILVGTSSRPGLLALHDRIETLRQRVRAHQSTEWELMHELDGVQRDLNRAEAGAQPSATARESPTTVSNATTWNAALSAAAARAADAWNLVLEQTRRNRRRCVEQLAQLEANQSHRTRGATAEDGSRPSESRTLQPIRRELRRLERCERDLLWQMACYQQGILGASVSLSSDDAYEQAWRAANEPTREGSVETRTADPVPNSATEPISTLRKRVSQLRRQLTEATCEGELTRLRAEQSMAERQFEERLEAWIASGIVVQTLQQRLRSKPLRLDQRVLSRAAALINTVTEGARDGLELRNGRLHVNDLTQRDTWTDWRQLNAGTQTLLRLCLHLAILQELASCGVRLPLLLDEALVNLDRETIRAFLPVLADAASEHQVLLFTCQETLRQVVRELQLPVLNLPVPTDASTECASPAEQSCKDGSADEKTESTVVADSEESGRELVRLHEVSESGSVETPDEDESAEPERRAIRAGVFYLEMASPITDCPGIDSRLANELDAIGVQTCGDLLALIPDTFAVKHPQLKLKPVSLFALQSQSLLMCQVPMLDDLAVSVLVDCGITNPRQLSLTRLEHLLVAVHDRLQQYRTHGLMESTAVETLRSVPSWKRRAARSRSLWESRETGGAGPRSHRRKTPFRLSHSINPWLKATASGQAAHVSASAIRRQDPPASDARPVPVRFYLQQSSPVEAAPEIGPRMAQRLETHGVHTVADLLTCNAETLAERLNHPRVKAERIRNWQRQAEFVCRVPLLRGHDAQILVALEIPDPEQLAAMTPTKLFAMVEPFAETRQGARIIRAGRKPDLEEVTNWIAWAKQARRLKAA